MSERTSEKGGYKKPPKAARFRSGASGNPSGRPRGSRNFANVVHDVLDLDVTVRRNGKVEQLPASEAAIRVQVGKAVNGNMAAINFMLALLETTGNADDVTEEERRERTMVYPRPYTGEEMELVMNDVFGKERAWKIVKQRLRQGDALLLQGERIQAQNAYRAELKEKGDDPVVRAGCILGLLLYADRTMDLNLKPETRPKQFEIALRSIDEALSQKPCFDVTWATVMRAHCLMLAGREAEAKSIYESFDTPDRVAFLTWESRILQDFEAFKARGIAHPLMDEITKRYNGAGWTTERINMKHRSASD